MGWEEGLKRAATRGDNRVTPQSVAAIKVANNNNRGSKSGKKAMKSRKIYRAGRGEIKINDSYPFAKIDADNRARKRGDRRAKSVRGIVMNKEGRSREGVRGRDKMVVRYCGWRGGQESFLKAN